MKEYVEIKRQGIFYNVYGKDAYIITNFTDYKITNGRSGFPLNSIDKVKEILNKNKVNYIIIDEDITEEKNFKTKNKYKQILKESLKRYEDIRDKESLLKNINKLSPDKIKQISKYVNYIIYK